MGYIWERKNWNEFTFSPEKIEKAYSLYLERKTIADRIFMPMERDYLSELPHPSSSLRVRLPVSFYR